VSKSREAEKETEVKKDRDEMEIHMGRKGRSQEWQIVDCQSEGGADRS